MEWITIGKKSKSRIRGHDTGTSVSKFLVSYMSFREKIQACKEVLLKEDWVKKLCRVDMGKVIAVGLGNFSCSHYAICQHALYEILVEMSCRVGEVYEPGYLSEEIEYLEEKGFLVNFGEFDKEQLEKTTFLMVHCHFTLYERLLASEWTSKVEVIVIGNSFEDVKRKFTNSGASQKADGFQSTEIKNNDLAFNQTFINTSIL